MSNWDTSQDYPPSPRPWLLPLLGCAIVVLGGLLVYRIATSGGDDVPGPGTKPRPVTPRGELTAAEQTTIDIFKTASPAVVHITNIGLRRRVFRMNPMEIQKGTGTGFIWNEDGYIVTNFHVVEGGQKWRVTLVDNSIYDARPIGSARDRDLAVLKIDAPREKLRPILIGTSHDLVVGQHVFAIGNPFGLDQTLTTGVISGLDREIDSRSGGRIRGVIQTDAAINPGNSGGPLLDSAGRLIGVNTAIASPSGVYAGIGFAVPVDIVNVYVPHIIRKGSVRAGLAVDTWSDGHNRHWRVAGAILKAVDDDSSAARAGLKPSVEHGDGQVSVEDVIIEIDGDRIRLGSNLDVKLADRDVGDKVTLTVVNEGRKRDVEVVLEAVNR
ncbi:MAG: 2-alkenal reductase [Planctomycetes bacterium]|nr:2-alkenal reductase [Planctomycetota bacterium]